jgi:hypothetical protein
LRKTAATIEIDMLTQAVVLPQAVWCDMMQFQHKAAVSQLGKFLCIILWNLCIAGHVAAGYLV